MKYFYAFRNVIVNHRKAQKNTKAIISIVSWMDHFIIEHLFFFFLLEGMSDKECYFRRGIWQTLSPKRTRGACHVKENTGSIWCPWWNMNFYGQIRTLENSNLALWCLAASQCLRTYLTRSAIFTKRIFSWHSLMKCVNFEDTCTTQEVTTLPWPVHCAQDAECMKGTF